jgi:hypothetical protein
MSQSETRIQPTLLAVGPEWIVQYVKKLFETNKGNFSESKPIIGRRITFNPEEIGTFLVDKILGRFFLLFFAVKNA